MGGRGGGGEGAPSDFSFFFFPCSADRERDWLPCKVVFGLAINSLNVRNNNNKTVVFRKTYDFTAPL